MASSANLVRPHPFSPCLPAVCAAVAALTASAALINRRKTKRGDGQPAHSRVLPLLGENAQLTPLVPIPKRDEGDSAEGDGTVPTMLTTLSRAKNPPSDERVGANDERREPTVVFVHGFGCNSLEFAQVARDISRKTGLSVFIYDRIVLGSGAYPLPRTAARLVKELLVLLRNRRVAPPYLLVGHSYGGLIAQCFAMSRPDDVAGLVLIDPAHEEMFSRMPWDMTLCMKLSPAVMMLFRLLAPAGILQLLDRFSQLHFPPLYLYDPERRAAARRLYSRREAWDMVLAEWRGLNLTFQRMSSFRRERAPLAEGLPRVVILAADRKFSPTLNPRGVTEAFVELNRPLTDGVGGWIVLADDSDHWVHLQSPDVVIGAVCDVYRQHCSATRH